MRSLALASLLLAFLPDAAVSQRAAHWEAMLPRGPHAVGLDTLLLRDRQRTFRFEGDGEGRSGARPVRLLIWRPVASEGRAALSFGQYAELVGFEARERVDSPASAAARGRREMIEYLASLGADGEKAAAALELPMLARRGAPPTPGPFPLVVLAVGKDDSPVLHAVAGEYLASHGFVVVGAPGLGAEERGMQWTAADLEAQARDLALVRTWARTQRGIDAKRVAIVAFSFGSGPSLLAALRDSSIGAIVSLDGSIGFADRVPIHRELPDLAARLKIPVLHLNVAGAARNDLTLLRELAADLTIAGFAGAGHLDFTSLASLTAAAPDLVLARLGDDTWASPGNVHAAAMGLVRTFLESHLSRRSR